jgi:hypothetical protein
MVCPQLRLPEALAWSRTPATPGSSWCVWARETIRASGLLLTGFEIRPLTGRKADSDQRNLAYNLRQLEWDIHLARALCCPDIGVFGGAPNEKARKDLVAGIAQLLDKIPDIRLHVGSRPETCLITRADYRAVLPQQPERARLLLDTGALRAAGEDPLAVARAFPGRLGSMRLDPSATDTAALLETLTACGYEGPLTVDLPPAATAARKHWP